MAIEDIGIRLTYDARDFVNTAEQVVKHFDEIDKKSEETNKKIADDTLKVTDAIDKENSELADNVNNLKKAATEQKNLSEEQKKSNNVLIDKIKNYKVFGVSLNDITQKYNSVASSGTAVGKVLSLNTTLVKAFGVAFKLALGPIGLLLAGIIAYFTRTQRGIDTVKRVLAGLGAAVDVIVDRFSGLGEAAVKAFRDPGQAVKDLWELIKSQIVNRIEGIINLFGSVGSSIQAAFNFDFETFKKEAGEAGKALIQITTGLDENQQDALANSIKGVVNEIKNESAAAVDLEKRKQALIIAERNLAIETANTRARVKELNKDAEDTTKSILERKKAAEEAVKIEQDLLNKRIELENENLAIIQKQNALGESLNDDLQAEADARIQIADLQQNSLELQTTLQNKLNIINAEGLRQIQAQKEAYQELYSELQDQLQNLEFENADPITKLQLQQEAALKALELQKTRLIEAAEAIGESTEGIDQAFTKLAEGLQKRFNEKVNEALELKIDNIELDDVGDTFGDFDFDTVVPENFFDEIALFKKNLIEGLSLSDEDVKAIEDSFSTLFTIAFADVQGIDKQIEANRRYREELAKTTENIEDQLEEQQSLREQGLANDVDLLEKALNEQNALQEKAQKEAEELQRKRARAELISNLASQVSNLATAATKIFSAHSGIPFAGVAIAIGAIASMYSAFKQFKAEASADVSLHTGTGRGRRVSDYFGYVNKGGQSDIPGRGQGYRIEGTNVRIGGDEFLSTEEAARAQGKFLADLNENPNRYKGIDINEVIREYHYNKIKEKENKSTYSGKEAKVIHLKDFKSLQNSSLIKELAVINNSENKKDSQIITVFDNQNTIDKVLREKLSLKESIIQNNNDLVNNSILKEKVIKEYAALEKNLSGIYHNVYDILNYHYGNADQMIENNTINVMNLAEYLRSYDNTHHKSDIEIAPGITEKINSNYLKVKELVSNISYDTKMAQSNYEKSIVEKIDSPTVKEMSKKLDSVISELTQIRNKPTTYSIADNTKKIVKEWPGRKETVEL